jgi:hypothetical protein
MRSKHNLAPLWGLCRVSHTTQGTEGTTQSHGKRKPGAGFRLNSGAAQRCLRNMGCRVQADMGLNLELTALGLSLHSVAAAGVVRTIN